MTPLYFGASTRRLFGVYTPSLAGGAGGAGTRAAVLCAPHGQEYLCAHRSLRQLGKLLASAGCHVLRFDYYGTGDSGGHMDDADLDGWQADIATAIEELKDTCGATRVSLVGLRLGAALAAQVAIRRARDTAALVMWDPVVHGESFLAEQLQAGGGETPGAAPAIVRSAEQGGGHEVMGFALPARLEEQITALDLRSSVASLPKRSLSVWSQDAPHRSAFHAALQARAGDGLAGEFIEGLPAWLNEADTGAGAVPVNVLQRITQWLTQA